MIVVEIGKISFKAWDITLNKPGIEVKRLILKKRLNYSVGNDWDFFDSIAKDLAEELKSQKIKIKNIALMLDDEIIQKEFTHQKASKENINKLAKIEAETALRESVSEFTVLCRQDGDRVNANNEQTSVLYALRNTTISKILETFSKNKLRVTRIVPVSNAYANAVKRLLAIRKAKDMFNVGEFAAIDFSEEKTLITIYQNYKVVFQRRQNSVFYDLVSLLCQVGGYDWNTASEMLYSQFDTESFPQEFLEGASSLISTSVYDVLRSARISTASDGQQIANALISGELCLCPVFYDRMINNLNMQYININSIAQQLPGIIKVSEKDSSVAAALVSCGVALPSDWLADIMDSVRKNRRKIRLNVTASAALAGAVVIAMCVLPAVYYFNQMILLKDEKNINEFAEAKALYEQSVVLKDKINNISDSEKLLSDISSRSSDILFRVFNTYSGSAEITSFTYDGRTGEITSAFNVGTVDGFVKLKDKIYADSFFALNLNMEFSQAGNNYNGKLRFTSKEVTPPSIGNEGAK